MILKEWDLISGFPLKILHELEMFDTYILLKAPIKKGRKSGIFSEGTSRRQGLHGPIGHGNHGNSKESSG